jgi:hypothetical protein
MRSSLPRRCGASRRPGYGWRSGVTFPTAEKQYAVRVVPRQDIALQAVAAAFSAASASHPWLAAVRLRADGVRDGLQPLIPRAGVHEASGLNHVGNALKVPRIRQFPRRGQQQRHGLRRESAEKQYAVRVVPRQDIALQAVAAADPGVPHRQGDQPRRAVGRDRADQKHGVERVVGERFRQSRRPAERDGAPGRPLRAAQVGPRPARRPPCFRAPATG